MSPKNVRGTIRATTVSGTWPMTSGFIASLTLDVSVPDSIAAMRPMLTPWYRTGDWVVMSPAATGTPT